VTINEAIRTAIRKAHANAKPYWVIWECGEYQVADEEDMDTWFVGLNHDKIVCSCDSSGEIN